MVSVVLSSSEVLIFLQRFMYFSAKIVSLFLFDCKLNLVPKSEHVHLEHISDFWLQPWHEDAEKFRHRFVAIGISKIAVQFDGVIWTCEPLLRYSERKFESHYSKFANFYPISRLNTNRGELLQSFHGFP